MAGLIYGFCALAALTCAWLLLRGYQRTRHGLLLWSGLCFAILCVNNTLLVVDKLVLPHVDLSLWRSLSALAAMCVLIYGLVWETR